MNLDVLAKRTERVVAAADEDEKAKQAALRSFRRAIEIARAQQEDVQGYQQTLEALEAKFLADASDRALRKAANYASKRVELLSSKQSQHRKEVLGRAELLSQSQDANESLMRTRDLMMRELARVNEVNAVLVADSEKIRDVGSEYTQYDSALKTARGMVKNMQRRENTDKMLVGFGVAFFLVVVAYILKRRLLPFFSPVAWLMSNLYSLFYSNSEATTPLVENSIGNNEL